MEFKLSIIAALDEARGIGQDGNLPWHIPEDLRRFKEITLGHPIVMGRTTYESIGKPLPKRTNIILTRDTNLVIDGVLIAHSVDEALHRAVDSTGNQEIFVIGGGQIFKQTITLADKLYLTIVQGRFPSDTYFPEYGHLFTQVLREQIRHSNGYHYRFLELIRGQTLLG